MNIVCVTLLTFQNQFACRYTYVCENVVQNVCHNAHISKKFACGGLVAFLLIVSLPAPLDGAGALAPADTCSTRGVRLKFEIWQLRFQGLKMGFEPCCWPCSHIPTKYYIKPLLGIQNFQTQFSQ